ncbi:hypothetical protein Pmani_026153 [Petrolisthes manimaculis]|uniref:Uncharacterized protein n=1 Tax=Petrolisthes manimaculis TaxID=1843537 RepID=A0AAE1P6H7_9EUCA|nr:hypothetical protein Pmani_026153 [Petrolisthes manimaculis]
MSGAGKEGVVELSERLSDTVSFLCFNQVNVGREFPLDTSRSTDHAGTPVLWCASNRRFLYVHFDTSKDRSSLPKHSERELGQWVRLKRPASSTKSVG